MIYRRRASPLHAARAGAACAWIAALVLVAVTFDHPVVLAAALATVLIAAGLSGIGREVARGLPGALLLAVPIVAVNVLVSHHGLTVIARLGTYPALGRVDVTLEAVAYGGVLALRILLLVLIFRLYTLAVDPDEVLKLFRRISFRSALTATLATRMVPLLARDGRRLADAQRCRPDAGARPARLALVRAVSAGALDRAIDVAAALEVRGYGAARRPAAARRPWSRHDLAFVSAAAALVAGALAARGAGLAAFTADTKVQMSLGAGEVALAGALALIALLPLTERRGVAR